MDAITVWLGQNYLIVVVALIWIAAMLVPRPHPDDKNGLAKILWFLIDRLSLLTNERLGGKFKPPFVASPRPPKPEQEGSGTKDNDQDE